MENKSWLEPENNCIKILSHHMLELMITKLPAHNWKILMLKFIFDVSIVNNGQHGLHSDTYIS